MKMVQIAEWVGIGSGARLQRQIFNAIDQVFQVSSFGNQFQNTEPHSFRQPLRPQLGCQGRWSSLLASPFGPLPAPLDVGIQFILVIPIIGQGRMDLSYPGENVLSLPGNIIPSPKEFCMWEVFG
jgi:hypothetical protein